MLGVFCQSKIDTLRRDCIVIMLSDVRTNYVRLIEVLVLGVICATVTRTTFLLEMNRITGHHIFLKIIRFIVELPAIES